MSAGTRRRGLRWPGLIGIDVAGPLALWHRLNLRPLPHQHGSLALGRTAGAWAIGFMVRPSDALPVLPHGVVAGGPEDSGDLGGRAAVGDLELGLGVARRRIP